MNTRKRKNVDGENKEKWIPKTSKGVVRSDTGGHDDDDDDDIEILSDMPAPVSYTSKGNPSDSDGNKGMDMDVQMITRNSFVSPSKGGISYETKKSSSGSEEEEEEDSDVQIMSKWNFASPSKGGRSIDNRKSSSSSEEEEDRDVQTISKRSSVTPSKGCRSYENRKSSSSSDFLSSEEEEDRDVRPMSEKSSMRPSKGCRSHDNRKSSSCSVFSSSEDEEDTSDDNFTGESGSSDSQSGDSSYCTDDFCDGGGKRDHGNFRKVESYYQERVEHKYPQSSATENAKNLVDGNAREEHETNIRDGLKKIRADGLDILVDLNRTDKGKKQRRSLHLRPRSIPEFKKKYSKFGTYSRPLCIDEDENHNSSDEDGTYSDLGTKNSKEGIKKVWKPSKNRFKSKSVCIKTIIDSIVDSILGKGEALDEILAANKEEAPTRNSLPLKFRFEDEDLPASPEKTEWEKEVDSLFTELEMCLKLFDNDSDTAPMAEDNHVTAQAKIPAEQCPLGGDHQLVLDEPIGIICRHCQIVCLEMKYIFPDLKMLTPGMQDSVHYEPVGCPMFDEFHLSDSAYVNYSTLKPTEGHVLDLIPVKVRMSMYIHQIDGFEFLWKNVVGETIIEKLQSDLSTEGSGCIISHAPGTGKTCLSIAFIMSMMRFYPTCRPVIVAPHSMLLTWEYEFKKWNFGLPFYNLNSEELSGTENGIAAPLYHFSQRPNEKDKRRFNRVAKLYSWANQRSVLGVSYQLFEKIANGSHGEKVKKILLELPGFLVLDEGHTPRNKRSHMWEALSGVKTRRRIILSGTPFQNNVDELCNTLSLVNPELSANKKDFKSITELKAMIDPLVHVYKGSILQESLPGLKDMLVKLRPTDLQQHALQLISDITSFLEKVHLVSLISVHPSLATDKMESLLQEGELGFLNSSSHTAGVKTKFVMALVALCEKLHEKVLIFSEFIEPLKFIKQQLEDKCSWIEGREILYMDGKQGAKLRQSSINSLNAPESEVKVFLASTKACSEGINLVGASRVVLLDVVWNPSIERQAISRAYRLGQRKVVYVYHLITSGTLEEDKYEQQMKKHHLSERLFSCQDGENKEKFSSAVGEDKVLEAMIDSKNLKDMFEDIVHNPKESNLFEDFNFLEPKRTSFYSV